MLLFLSALLISCEKSIDPISSIQEPTTKEFPIQPTATNSPLILSEIQIENAEFKGQFQQSPGWVEIQNRSDSSVNLSSYQLIHNQDSIWNFPEILLLSKERFLLFCSRKDIYTPQLLLSQNFEEGEITPWADSHRDPPGTSNYNSTKYPNYSGTNQNGYFEIAANLTLKDNGEVLSWSHTQIRYDFPNPVSFLESENYTLLLRAKLTKDKVVELHFCDGADSSNIDFTEWLIGTGKTQEYWIELPRDENWPSTINCIQFEAPKWQFGSIDFEISPIRFFTAKPSHSNFKLSKKGGRLTIKGKSTQEFFEIKYPEIPPLQSLIIDSEFKKYTFTNSPTPGTPTYLTPHTGQT